MTENTHSGLSISAVPGFRIPSTFDRFPEDDNKSSSRAVITRNYFPDPNWTRTGEATEETGEMDSRQREAAKSHAIAWKKLFNEYLRDAKGKSKKEIGDLLCISVRAVERHHANRMNRLNTRKRLNLCGMPFANITFDPKFLWQSPKLPPIQNRSIYGFRLILRVQ